MDNRTMLTDLYQLTMNAAYFRQGKNDTVTFDLFIRSLPKDWGYFIAAGVEDAADIATGMGFTKDDVEYLRSQNLFTPQYLEMLGKMRFTGDIWAVREGTPTAANTTLLRVTAPRMEAQLLETALLNTINFQTMITTKADRVVRAAAPGAVFDFGLRRAQEADAGMKGARAAYIGGAAGTSNVAAGMRYGIPIKGTHAHSFIMGFPDELTAFRAYAAAFPHACTLLIDTYDTMQGARNALIVAKEMEARGERLAAVRLDSGDLAQLSKDIRALYDANGLNDVKIVASNDLNEYKIAQIRAAGGCIDAWGVGTEMITAKPVAAIPGVYKLVQDSDGPKIKLAVGKTSYPGIKQVYRQYDAQGKAMRDVLALEGEQVDGEPLLVPLVKAGQRVGDRQPLAAVREYLRTAVSRMPQYALEVQATQYHAVPSNGLDQLVYKLQEQYGGRA